MFQIPAVLMQTPDRTDKTGKRNPEELHPEIQTEGLLKRETAGNKGMLFHL